LGDKCNVGNLLYVPIIHTEFVLSRLYLVDIIFNNSSRSYNINNSNFSNQTFRINMQTDTHNDIFMINLPLVSTIAEGVHYTFYITDNGNIGINNNTLTFTFGTGRAYGNIIANGITITVSANLQDGEVYFVTGGNSLYRVNTGVSASILPNSQYTQNTYYNGVMSMSFKVSSLSLGDKIEIDFTDLGGRWMVSGVLNNYSAVL